MPSNVVAFPDKPKTISTIRSREAVLQLLIPKMLGIIWNKGGPDMVEVDGIRLAIHGENTARIADDLAVGGFYIGPGIFGVHVYAGPALSEIKVFSAHLADRAVTAGPRWTYFENRCCILSWKRGTWEDRVIAEKAGPRTIAHVLTGGLTRGARPPGIR